MTRGSAHLNNDPLINPLPMRFLSATLIAAALISTSSVEAVEINGQTSFVAVPTKAKLTNYSWYAFQGAAVYYLTLEFPEGAGTDLGGINLEQIQGQKAFSYGAVPVQAFIGTPRHQGRSLDVEAEFSDDARSVDVNFSSAVNPGDTVTIAFQAGVNPPQGFYTFSVTAIPAGPNPVHQMVGVVDMKIFQNEW